MLPKDLIRRIRRLEIRTRKQVTSVLAGQYHSVFKGRGMAFSEVRQYQPGDEIRIIDWNVTARMREPYVKVFTEERELTVMLLVDVSASESFGSKARAKFEVAAEVAAQIAFSAIANNDRVGLILFSDRVEKVVVPKKGRTHVLRVITEILDAHPTGRGTKLNVGLNAITQLTKRKAVTFLISDFLAAGHERELRVTARRHDLIPVVISDPLEHAFPKVGLVSLEDPETGQRVIVDASDPFVRGEYARAMQRMRDERNTFFKRLELDFIELSTDADNASALTKFFQLRARRLAA